MLFRSYQLTGDVITLPYTTTPLIQQVYASRLENINPFAIFTFLGDVQLNPPTDDWFETNKLPDIINQVMGNFTTISSLAAASGILGTVWNAWQTQWSGTPQVTTTFSGNTSNQYGVNVMNQFQSLVNGNPNYAGGQIGRAHV